MKMAILWTLVFLTVTAVLFVALFSAGPSWESAFSFFVGWTSCCLLFEVGKDKEPPMVRITRED